MNQGTMDGRAGVRHGWLIVAMTLLLACGSARAGGTVDAADGTAPPSDGGRANSADEAFWRSLHPQHGNVDLPNGQATLHLGNDWYWLAPKEAARVLTEAWHNPPGNDDTQGMIFPTRYRPTDERAWGIVLSYVEDGHVDDADAKTIDYTQMLKDMQAATREENAERKKQGYPEFTLVGWAEPPYYDAARHSLHWAKDLTTTGATEHTLNYEVRTLGRKGVLQMDFVAGMSQLAEVKQNIDAVIALPEYKAGHRYIDFDPSIDKVAAYGIGALIAGKVAAKFGLLAGALLFLKKGWLVLVAGGGWLVRKLRGQGDDAPPPPPVRPA